MKGPELKSLINFQVGAPYIPNHMFMACARQSSTRALKRGASKILVGQIDVVRLGIPFESEIALYQLYAHHTRKDSTRLVAGFSKTQWDPL